MNTQKRILAINDISCFGKCSLTVATPLLSAAGIEVCALPTAVLSTHTAFDGYTFRDLTDDLIPIAQHWNSLPITFDGIYTGYLGSKKQVASVEKIIDMFKKDVCLVDPVMGDNGKLYSGFDTDYVIEMRRLVKKAGIITPNVTEGAFLSGIPYENKIHSKDYIESIAEKLTLLCAGKIVLTGINLSSETVGTAVFDKNKIHIIENEKYDIFYSGTGDVFASTLASCIMSGFDIVKSASVASSFVTDCILETKKTSGNRNYGVNFELCITKFLKRLEII